MTPRPIAFYLPQFHPSGVNDANWGPGFSEWRNVVKAQPLFEGHFQPRLPGALGFYDLRAREVLLEQAAMAADAGIYGFCFYYYRMGADRVLHRPVDSYLSRSTPDFPFMYCWANESWTRAWDGRSNAVLLEQTYGPETVHGLADDLAAAFRDSRYIRVKGKPFFLIYQLDKLPNRVAWLSELRERVHKQCGQDMLLGCVYSPGLQRDMLGDVDTLVQFPPHRMPRARERELLDAGTVNPFDRSRGDNFEQYESIVAASLAEVAGYERMYPGVTPDWDNSPRRGAEAHIVVGSTPDLFEDWVCEAGKLAVRRHRDSLIDAPLFFVNAWNEWAEGAVLEPSEVMGMAYLQALSNGLSRVGEELLLK